MKLIRIFTPENSEDGIWSVHSDSAKRNEFASFFKNINDIEYLREFFAKNANDLDNNPWGTYTVEDAIIKTIEDAAEMEDTLEDCALQARRSNYYNLQHLFKPLNNFEYSITVHQKSKARIKRSWLRLYAIRVDINCFVVTGGAIKLTLDMRRDYLQEELKKLEQTRIFLRENNFDYPEDLKF
ncbi:MAG TPA: hypothetical protein VM802_22270 [Chitinophaga sp.]|uniref:hypothetical protein n=1 Tax=Chitinophaga sp. TaxID=1869181 RepID=UPI002C197A5E|nr:hypothetical protein [Chitinophaga sp.]HVI47613.1 hypothetical protein [Chitinophaga sp.]